MPEMEQRPPFIAVHACQRAMILDRDSDNHVSLTDKICVIYMLQHTGACAMPIHVVVTAVAVHNNCVSCGLPRGGLMGFINHTVSIRLIHRTVETGYSGHH